jgi:iron complex outermembrane recepter protein
MLKKVTTVIVCAVLLSFFSASAYSETETDDFLEMSLYELMNVKVTTAGRLSQNISEAPAAMSVVTAEDIRQSGAISLSEALEMVVGVHLGYTSSVFQAAGGIRGFHKLPANKIVLLIDGVPWSFEMYDVPGLNQIPIALEEIEKIEVMRGPGSSLYGANAMFGVINVITKKPETTQGTLFSVTAGEHDTLIGTMMHGGAVDEKLFYRITMGWNQTDNHDYIAWSSDPGQEYWKINTSLDYLINDNSSVSLFAGYLDPNQQDVIVESTGPVDQSGADTFRTVLTYKAKDPNVTVKAHLKDTDWGAGYSFGEKSLNFKMGTRGVEFQHKWKPFTKDTLVWGGNFDQKYAEGPSISGKHTHDLPGIFFDNTFDVTDQISLNTGLRCDKHPNTDYTASHRVSLLYAPHTSHNFRLTWGTSYRNPDFVESYYSRMSPYGEGAYLHVFGQQDIDPEKADTYELGYYGQLSEKCVFSVNLFYSELEDFIYFVQDGDPYFDEELNAIVIPVPFKNIGDAEQYGAEVELNYQITRWLNGIINYSYSDQNEKDDQIRELLDMTPQHMANGQLRARFDNGISANASVHYKDVTEWREYLWASPEGDTMAGGRADSYIYANLRLGYEFALSGNDAEVGVAAFNVFNTKFDDFPLSTSDVTRRVTGSFLIHF